MTPTPRPTGRVRPRRALVGAVLGYGGRLVVAVLAVFLLATLTVGLPWSLTRFIGWPLPHQIPSWGQAQETLTQPASASMLVNTLACILWLAWAVFIFDLTRAVADQVRNASRPKLPLHRGPIQAAAAALVGAVVLSILTSRSPSFADSGATSSTSQVLTPPTDRSTPVLAADHHPTVQVNGSVGRPTTGRAPVTVEVQPPHRGVHDSLWRIAERTLGDGNRWPEIYHLNRGRPQPDGHTLTSPSLIRPGWILRVPAPPGTSARPNPASPAPHSPVPDTVLPPRTSTPSPRTTTPSLGSTATAPTPSAGKPLHLSPAPTTRHGSGRGLDLPTGAFVSAGLAALVAAALLAVRRRRRKDYQPGTGGRADLSIAPVVRALRIAHEDLGAEAAETELPPPSTDTDSSLVDPAPAAEEPPTETGIGIKDGRPLAWNLARTRTRGLGLIGPGADDAARALLVSLLAERSVRSVRQDHHVTVLMPTADALQLLGTDEPPAVQLADTLDTALDVLEAELLARLRSSTDSSLPRRTDLVLVASANEYVEHRLQAILDNGSTLGVAGILLGQWRPGGTARVRADGTVAATSPTLDTLTDARLFTLPTTDATDLLELLHQAQPEAAAVRPPAPRTPEPAVHPQPQLTPAPLPHRTERRRLGPGRTTPPTAPAPEQPETPQPEPTRAAPSSRDDDTTDEPDPTPAPDQSVHPTAAHRPWRLTVLGRIHLTHHQPDGAEHADASPALAPKHREVLTYLALHPHGARREALAAAIWPNAPTDRPYNSFHATMSQLRRALRAAAHDDHLDITTHTDDGRYTLDPNAIDVDLWQLHTTLDEARGTQEPTDANAFHHALALYQGDLAADLTAEWLEAPRESLRRDILDLISTRARTLRDAHPDQALTLLEHARTLDTYNEAVYRAIARLQARLGQWEAIPRTHTLLTTTLAAIDEHPSPETESFFTALQRPVSQRR